MITFAVISIILLPGIVFFSNIISIENIIWKNFDMSQFKRPSWQVLNPFNMIRIFMFGYPWILFPYVRRLIIRSILEQTKKKMDADFEKCSRLRDVGLTIYDKFG